MYAMEQLEDAFSAGGFTPERSPDSLVLKRAAPQEAYNPTESLTPVDLVVELFEIEPYQRRPVLLVGLGVSVVWFRDCNARGLTVAAEIPELCTDVPNGRVAFQSEDQFGAWIERAVALVPGRLDAFLNAKGRGLLADTQEIRSDAYVAYRAIMDSGDDHNGRHASESARTMTLAGSPVLALPGRESIVMSAVSALVDAGALKGLAVPTLGDVQRVRFLCDLVLRDGCDQLHAKR